MRNGMETSKEKKSNVNVAGFARLSEFASVAMKIACFAGLSEFASAAMKIASFAGLFGNASDSMERALDVQKL